MNDSSVGGSSSGLDERPLEGVARKRMLCMALMLTGGGFVHHGHAQDAVGGESRPSSSYESSERRTDERTTVTLPEVEVIERDEKYLPPSYAGDQIASGGRLGILGNRKVMDTPFNLTNYTGQVLNDQQVTTAAEVLAKDPSVVVSQTGGIVDSMFIRGFPINEGNIGEFAFDGRYGVAPNYRIFSDYVERMEVLKGPGALLYGMSPNGGVGGVVNIVPKRARDRDASGIDLDYAGKGQFGAHADLSRRFGQNREFGARLNARHASGKTPVDRQKRRVTVAAASIDYTAGKARATLDLLKQQEKFDAPSRPFFLAAGIQMPSAPSGRTNVSQQWGWSKIDEQSGMLKAEYELRSGVTVFGSVGAGEADVSRLSDQTISLTTQEGDTRAVPQNWIFRSNRKSADLGMNARVMAGGATHDLVVQLNHYEDDLSRGFVAGTPVLSNIHRPVQHPAQTLAAPVAPKATESVLKGVALADSVSVLDDRLTIIGGVRYQQIRSLNFDAAGTVSSTYDKNAVTPMLGASWRAGSGVSIYANYAEGLSRGDIAPAVASNAGEVFSPYKSKQREVGLKLDRKSILTTVSLFEIKKPSGQLNDDNSYSVGGLQRNRGIELNLAGKITRGARILGGASWLSSRLSGSPELNDKRAVGVPKWQVSLGGEWDAPWLNGLTLTGNFVYASEQYVDRRNQASLPAWHRIDIGARYSVLLMGHETILGLRIQNLLDKKYWSGVASYSTISLGAPRSVALTVSTAF